MELRITRIDEKATLPQIASNGNAFELTCTAIATGVGRDGRLVLEYKTGLEIDIPDGYVGMLFINDNCYSNSLVLTNSVATFLSDSPQEIVARFKTNTDSIPAIYEVGEVFAKMIIVELPTITITENIIPAVSLMSQSVETSDTQIVETTTTEELPQSNG